MFFTYSDAIEHLMSWRGFPRGSDIHVKARRAVQEAYRDLPQMGSFTRFERRFTFQAAAEQTTGTIAYTHSTKRVVLTGATWPADAVSRRLVINRNVFQIAELIDSTTVRLGQYDNPGADVASGTSYRLIQDAFQLPSDFRQHQQLFNVDSQMTLPVEQMVAQIDRSFLAGNSAGGIPFKALIAGGGDRRGPWLYLTPPPSSAGQYELSYNAQPRQLVVERFEAGTVSISGTTATFSQNIPQSVAEGTILRVGESADAPTGAVGGMSADGPMVDYPPAYELVVMERLSATTCRVDQSVGVTDKGYVLSDIVDFDSALLTAFQKLAEAKFRRLVDDKNSQAADAEAMDAVRQAKSFDRRVQPSPAALWGVPYFKRPVAS